MSPRSTKEFEKMRQSSQENILKAALKLFGSKGYDGTSISQIAKEAGVSKGLMYNYFDSKSQLLEGVLEMLSKEGEAAFMPVFTEQDPREKFRKLVETTANELKNNQDYYRLVTMLALQEASLEFILKIRDSKMAFYEQMLVELLSQLGIDNPEEEVFMLAAGLDGMSIQYQMTQDEAFLERTKNYLLKKYLNNSDDT